MNFLRISSAIQQNAHNHPDGAILIPGGSAGEEFQSMRRRLMQEAQHSGNGFLARRIGESRTLRQAFERIRLGGALPVSGGNMADRYVVTSGSSAVSTSLKVMCALATGTTVTNELIAWDVTQNGALNATTAASQVDFQKTTTASSGGATATPNKFGAQADLAAQTTARVNDTTNGSTPTTYFSFFVPVVSGISYQYPLGREWTMTTSQFTGVAITGATAVSANYICNVYFSE